MMKLLSSVLLSLSPVLFFILLSVMPAALFAADIRQLTVNDYLQQAKTQHKKANHLINESSPYLLQHAYNPVQWYAWGEAAFEKAKKENKPIFLSIGYSTCHWCHVMAHESFENEKIAAILNKYFVCIKVDREQRPDIDSIYMSATELINGHGGWPMTVFLDHQLRPFHAATYYPPFTNEKSLGLEDVLLKLHELWLKNPEKINEVATAVTSRIAVMADDTVAGGELANNVVELALQQIIADYDELYGGFSVAPKFPRPGIFSFLNQLALKAKDQAHEKDEKSSSLRQTPGAEKMMKTTLDAMAAGGIYDQLAGGFHRYSVDDRWQVPHFEKMLYSQALMVMAYSDFYEIEPQQKYRNIVDQTLNFVINEMRSPDGGYYSALDADSERADKPGDHAEGAYYLWHLSELKARLSKDEFLFIEEYFEIKENGNIESDPQNEFADLNILHVAEAYRNRSLSRQQLKWLSSAKEKLNKVRYQRPRPHLDDKVITAWNGMLITAFARAAVVFDEPDYLAQAVDTITYVQDHLYSDKTKKLSRQYRDTGKNMATGMKSPAEATLADYVWIIYGLLEVYQASNNAHWLNWAIELHAKQNELFLDEVSGAYFESVAGDATLLFRSKNIYDGALPSPNAIALANLRKLSGLVDGASQQKALTSQADKLVSSFASVINQSPASAAALLAMDLKTIEARQSTMLLQ